MSKQLQDIFKKLVDKEQEFNENGTVESLNSSIITSIDFKKLKVWSLFFYETFRVDETVNDTKPTKEIRKQIGSDTVVSQRLSEASRFINLYWNGGASNEIQDFRMIFRRLLSSEIHKFINDGKINDINNFSGGKYFNLILRDSGTDNKLFTIVSSSYEALKQKQLRDATKNIVVRDENIASILGEKLSSLEKARVLNASLNSQVTRKFVSDEFVTQQQSEIDNDLDTQQLAMNIVNSFGSDLSNDTDYVLFNENSNNLKANIVEAFKNIQFKGVINNKYLYTVSKSVENDTASIFCDEFANFNFIFKNIEKEAIIASDSLLELSVLDRSIASIENLNFSNFCMQQRERIEEQNNLEEIVIRFIGYIIDKYYIDEAGNKKIYAPTVIDNNDRTSYKDTEILYGVTYYYKVSQLAELIVPFVDSDTGNRQFARILIKGDGNMTSQKAEESIPPSPPRDFSMRYSSKKKALHLSWATSLDKQKDVTKYLIFKRDSLNVCFTLVGVIDFTPERYMPIEARKYEIDESVVFTKEEFEITNFFDEKFKTNEKAIYAVVAGDAHERYSAYSIQLEAHYNLLDSTITMRKVSDAGAPIPYPNFYAESKLFDNAIFTSKAKQLKLIFSPDAAQFISRTDEGLANITDVLASKNNESYKLNIVNTDLGLSETIDIRIEDNRGRI